jgi:hypothetical protein
MKMTKFFVIAFALVMSTAAFATQSFDASKTTCADLQAALQKDGSLSIQTIFGNNYYVSSPSACDALQVAIPSYEASSDSLLCQVGYSCRAEEQGGGHR